MLAESAALAAADMARDVHLGTWLGKGEIAWTKAYLRVGTKHLAGKRQQHLLQVGEGHILVYVKSLHLVEEAVGASGYSLVAVNPSRTDDADGGL